MRSITGLSLCLVLWFCIPARAAATLNGDTNAPETSMFPLGEKVELVYKATGITPADGELTLELNIVDEKEKAVRACSIPVKADEEGNWSTTVEPPCDRLGFYRVYSRLSNGVTLAKLGSRKAGFLTYAVVFGEKRYEPYPMDETFFGNHGPSFGYHRMIGLKWGYAGRNFASLEPTKPGEYADNPEADKIDLLGKACPRAGEYVETSQNTLPKWMQDEKYRVTKDGKLVRFTPEGEKVYADYLRVFAKNYAEQLKSHQPRAFIQVTWEPMFPWGFGGTPEDIVRIHRIAYEAIHGATSDAWLIGPTAAGLNSVDWHRELFEAGLLKYVDAISIHPYFQFPPEQHGMVETIRSLKALIREYAGRDLDIHANEAGFATHELPERENMQMYGIVRSNLILLGEGFKSNMVFYSHDYWGEPGYGYTYNLNPKREWGTDKVGPKPLVPVIGAAACFLNGHTTAGAIEYLGDTAWGYAYQRKDGFTTLALWDYSGNPRQVEIPVGRDEIVLGDMMGNTRRVNTIDGNVKLTLNEDPLYVVDVDPEIWGRGAVRMIAVDESSLAVVAGQTVALGGKINARQKALSGTLVLSGDREMNMEDRSMEIHCGPGETVPYEISISLPENLPEGKSSLQFRLFSEGRAVAVSGVSLAVRAPVAIHEVLPAFVDGKKSLKFDLAELAGVDAGGNIETRIVGNPDGRKRLRFELQKNSRFEAVCVFDDLDINPLRKDRLELTVVTDSGYRLKKEYSVNFLNAVYRPEVTVDGDFSDWSGIPACPFDPSMVVDEAKIYGGRQDLDASVAVVWNEKFLLFYVDVRDNVYLQPYTGWLTWSGDSLQMAFSKAVNYRKTGNMYQDRMNLAYSEIDFALTEKGPEVYRTITFAPEQFPVAPVSLDDAPLKVVKTEFDGGGVRLQYEIAVPWSFLNTVNAPAAGDRIGWALTVNDRDVAKTNVRAYLQAFELKKPEEFGIIVLTK